MSAEFETLAAEIEKLPLPKIGEFVKFLEDRWGVTAAAPMAMPMMMAGGAPAAEAVAEQPSSTWCCRTSVPRRSRSQGGARGEPGPRPQGGQGRGRGGPGGHRLGCEQGRSRARQEDPRRGRREGDDQVGSRSHNRLERAAAQTAARFVSGLTRRQLLPPSSARLRRSCCSANSSALTSTRPPVSQAMVILRGEDVDVHYAALADRAGELGAQLGHALAHLDVLLVLEGQAAQELAAHAADLAGGERQVLVLGHADRDGWNSGIHVLQHSSRPQRSMPPSSLA